ncbi:MAG: hypothetical protein FWG84_06285 [Bacteroidales bacterium]|nr:hypothetical protein [Bacteroidales bacterium]
MTVVSTQEFNTQQEKYFDMAVDGDVCIQNDKYMFRLICNPVDMIDRQVTLQPDDDFRRAITKDELLEGIYEDIAKRFAKR